MDAVRIAIDSTLSASTARVPLRYIMPVQSSVASTVSGCFFAQYEYVYQKKRKERNNKSTVETVLYEAPIRQCFRVLPLGTCTIVYNCGRRSTVVA